MTTKKSIIIGKPISFVSFSVRLARKQPFCLPPGPFIQSKKNNMQVQVLFLRHCISTMEPMIFFHFVRLEIQIEH